MCGIAGEVKFAREAPVDVRAVKRMCAAMLHRGPDDEGIYCAGPVWLGMRRLSIVDLSTGHQPISNEDGTLWIVFNGEIYNHQYLRDRLQTLGHRYKTRSDTESILHAYEEYGRDCVQHLRGMFAFAIWDARKRRLFVARDRLGIKPLYYRANERSFLFGSEIKVILAHPDTRPEMNREALPEFLAFGYLSGEDTFYKGIRKLIPGHTLEVDESGKLRIEPYWDLACKEESESHPSSYYVETYRDLLEHAVRSHLMSDVPVGVFLSGGLDSSAIAALMTKTGRAPVDTFSVGYSEHAYSELPSARIVARHLNSRHHEVVLSGQAFFDTLPKLIWHEDEPIAWPSSVPLYFVAQLASAHVKVVLTGEGSDETLAGYARYAFTLKNVAVDNVYRRLTPAFLRRAVRQEIAESSWLGANIRRKLSHTCVGLDGESWNSFYFDNFFSAFGAQDQTELLTDEFAQEICPTLAYRNVLKAWEQSSGEMLQRLLYTDIKTYLVELLMKQDNMTMAASVESRVPFLDHDLVEFAAKIPANVQIQGTAGKQILKKAVEDLLPHSIIYRRKLGFPTPWSGWLAGPQLGLIEGMLLEPRSIDRGFFKASTIRRIFAEHRRHHRDHYDRIWRLLTFELWQRVCLEGGVPHSQPSESDDARLAGSVS